MAPDRREPLLAHLRVLDEGVAPVMARHRADMQCGPGCGECCHQSFEVSSLEGELLREGLAQLDPAVRAVVRERATAWRRDQRMPCPLLDDDQRCRLYALRPRVCRKYGIPLWHPDRPHEVRTCPKNFRGVADIDAELILEPQAEWARDWIRVREATGLAHGDNASIAAHLLATNEPTHGAPTMIEPGQSAPHVDRIAHDGTHVRIGGPQPHVTVLYFYPKDETAGCVKEACAFRDSFVDFVDAGAVVVGVSDDDDASHRAFAEHRRLPFALLHDRGGELRTAYRVPDWLGLLRNRVTYVIDREGVVRMAFESQLRAGTHVSRALEIVRALGR